MKNTILLLAIILVSFNLNSQNWTKVESNTNLRLNSISFGSESVGYIGADGGTLLKTIDGGRNWNVILIDSSLVGIPMDIVDVQFQSATHGYIVYNYSQNSVHHQGFSNYTRDGGLTWISSPFGMCGPIGVHMTDTANGYFFGASCFGGLTIDKITNRSFVNTTYKSWSHGFLRGMDFYNSSYGITVGDFGKVYRTIDAGANWDTITPSFPQTFNEIKFVNDSLIFAVIDSIKSIVYSTDSGNTWQPHVNSLTFFRPVMKSLVVSSLDTVYAVGKSSIGSSAMIYWGHHSDWSWNIFNSLQVNHSFNSVAMSNSTRVFVVGDSGIIYTNMDFLTSIDENSPAFKLEVYPNPVSTFITIKSEKIKEITLYSMDGKIVLEQATQSSTQTIIDLPYLPSGMYLLKVTHEDNTIQFKKIALHL
ncbi:T9SS type A sorting domain-containing protein [Flavobacteriales bacterium]|nr:T9SS type A sorting domain-containing protein [Flavobacteriales bacterium]